MVLGHLKKIDALKGERRRLRRLNGHRAGIDLGDGADEAGAVFFHEGEAAGGWLDWLGAVVEQLRGSKTARLREQKKPGDAGGLPAGNRMGRWGRGTALRTRSHFPDCTLTSSMDFFDKHLRAAAGMALAGLFIASANSGAMAAQQAAKTAAQDELAPLALSE